MLENWEIRGRAAKKMAAREQRGLLSKEWFAGYCVLKNFRLIDRDNQIMWSGVDGETKIDFWEFWFMFNRQVILPSDNYGDAIVVIWVTIFN